MLFLYITLLINSGCVEGTSQRQPINGAAAQDRMQESAMIDREAAIRIVRERALTAYGSLEGYNVVPCEQKVFWRVFLEPRNPSSSNERLEYVVSKRSGRVIGQRELRLAIAHSTNGEGSSPRSISVSREDALAIARRDAIEAYSSLESYEITVCELSRVWRVVYSLRSGLDGGGPEYLIDTRTGQIVDKKYYQ